MVKDKDEDEYIKDVKAIGPNGPIDLPPKLAKMLIDAIKSGKLVPTEIMTEGTFDNIFGKDKDKDDCQCPMCQFRRSLPDPNEILKHVKKDKRLIERLEQSANECSNYLIDLGLQDLAKLAPKLLTDGMIFRDFLLASLIKEIKTLREEIKNGRSL
jgi:hypothetical protein